MCCTVLCFCHSSYKRGEVGIWGRIEFAWRTMYGVV